MKQGNKYLWSNGRGNYYPVSLLIRQSVKKAIRRLKKNSYTNESSKNYDLRQVKSAKHGIGLRDVRKSLNSKLRHLAKKNIRKELENE